ncbi:MAG: sodium:panthothenate symporter [Lentisphaeria bacterium]|nr:sodium:panthothenate symporter [Lentisphaeria bacterium]
MHWIDWLIVLIPMIIVIWTALRSQRYVTSVADFLAAGRVAGRYVVAVAGGEAAMGLISVVAMMEMYYKVGFAVSFWSTLTAPLGLIFALTGYCSYRYRETRAMTMGQFLEIRYNRKFRVLAAVLQSFSGVINYAIFPAVSARFLIYFLDLPATLTIGTWVFPTFGVIMAVFLGIAVFIISLGGQVTIMVTDCVQGLLSYPMYCILVLFILWKFSWSEDMAPALLNQPPGKSFLNPYDTAQLRDFNIFYVAVGMFSSIINRMSWSGTQGYSAAAINAHEQKMGGLLGTWRGGFSVMMYVVLAVAAYTYMTAPHFRRQAAEVSYHLAYKTVQDVAAPQAAAIRRDVLGPAPKSGVDYQKKVVGSLEKARSGKVQNFKTIYSQMLAPVAIKHMLPVGITGIFCAIMLFLMISTDTTYMHSWGSIIVQDVILPFRKQAFTPAQQLRLLRIVIAGVAVFAFLFSFFFSQMDYILMFFSITGAIWLGGAGPCIVFGLYWKRGTTAGATAALLSGSLLAVGGIVMQQMWEKTLYPWLVEINMVEAVDTVLRTASAPFDPYIKWQIDAVKFPINSQEIFFFAMLVSVTLYVAVSLLTCKKPFDMEKMLHRGVYSESGKPVEKTPLTPRLILRKLIGIDANYTRGDRILAWSVFAYSFVYSFVIIFLAVVVWNKISPWPASWWSHYFFVTRILVAGAIGLVSTVWFSIGGTLDLRRLFKRLAEKQDNVLDDGRVTDSAPKESSSGKN